MKETVKTLVLWCIENHTGNKPMLYPLVLINKSSPEQKIRSPPPREAGGYLWDFQGGTRLDWKLGEISEEGTEEQANGFETKKGRSGRNGRAGGKGKAKGVESPWFPQLCAEAGAYGGRVFKTWGGIDSKLSAPPHLQAMPSPQMKTFSPFTGNERSSLRTNSHLLVKITKWLWKQQKGSRCLC